jgi:hypothetical protein
VAVGPRPLGEGEAAAVTEQEFRQAMSGTQEIDANVFTAAQQVARGFFLLGGNVNGRERTGAIEHGQLGGIAAVGFDAIPGAPGNQRGGDDITGDLVGGQRPMQLEATRAGFVAALDDAAAPQTLDEAKQRRRVGA